MARCAEHINKGFHLWQIEMNRRKRNNKYFLFVQWLHIEYFVIFFSFFVLFCSSSMKTVVNYKWCFFFFFALGAHRALSSLVYFHSWCWWYWCGCCCFCCIHASIIVAEFIVSSPVGHNNNYAWNCESDREHLWNIFHLIFTLRYLPLSFRQTDSQPASVAVMMATSDWCTSFNSSKKKNSIKRTDNFIRYIVVKSISFTLIFDTCILFAFLFRRILKPKCTTPLANFSNQFNQFSTQQLNRILD